MPIVSIEELDALPQIRPVESDLYFLWHGGGLVYIRKSRNLRNRS
ncbi:MAG TPA: hypothetical protein VGR92_02740 [Steroidobacteraceae bacterium]|nr:hypothetical protein [Steroidobacteraceae bacterium]